MRKVLLLGAGPTNLATADRLLSRGGHEVEIIERLPWAGGLSKSLKHGPYTLDLGPHRFTPHTDEVYQYVKNLPGVDLQITNQIVEIWLENKFLNYPFRLGELLTKFKPQKSLRIGASMIAANCAKTFTPEAKNYKEWVSQRFGNETANMVFKPLIEKVWGTPLEDLSARFAYQRIAISSLWELLIDIIRGKRKAEYSSPYYPQNTFLYPKAGFESITEGMVQEIKRKGGKFRYESTVKKINIKQGRALSVEFETAGGQRETLTADRIVSTLPISLLPEMMNPAIESADFTQAAKNLKFRSLVLLYLVAKKDRVTHNTSMYFPGPSFPFGRTAEQKNHSETTVVSPDGKPRSVLTVELPCWRDDTTWKATDEDLLKRVMKSFEPCKILKAEDIEEYFTVRLGYVYPVWDLDFEKNVATILERIDPIENLILNGRPGLFFYNNIHHSLEMGFIAAEHILSGKPKQEKWLKDSQLFRDYHLVE